MIVNQILIVLLLHYIGDFILQTRWMGENKSKNIVALLMHILVYSATLSLFGNIKFAVVNGVFHLITDFITSRLSGYAYRKNDMYMFWSVIGADQLIHAVTLILTMQYFIGFI